MATGTRPGGLTAMAVLNFLHAAVGSLALIGTVFWCVMLATGAGPSEMKEARDQILAEMGIDAERLLMFFLISVAMTGAMVISELASGIGYLGQRRLLGWWCGNFYVLIAISNTVFALNFIPADAPGGGFTIGTMIGLVYPVYTAVLINTIFRRDFIRR